VLTVPTRELFADDYLVLQVGQVREGAAEHLPAAQ
jgi:hypothetical protein